MPIPQRFDDPRIVRLRTATRAHVQAHIVPNGDAWEALGTTPHAAYQALGRAGLLGHAYTEQEGGTALGPIGSVVFAEEISASSYGGVAEAVLIHISCAARARPARCWCRTMTR